MPKTTRGRSEPRERYWQTRVRSKPFRHSLTAAVQREIRALAAEQVKDVVDGTVVRTLIREWDGRLVDREIVADLLIEGNRRLALAAGYKRRGTSLLRWLDARTLEDLDAILGEDFVFSPHTEALVAGVMQQEFVRRLFTDVIFTAIVAFYQRVNPFFGAMAMRALEEQIKGFIRLFMPMLQRQATAFATNKANQRILLDFSRSIVRQLLDQPLRDYAAMLSPGQRKKMETVIRNAVGNARGNARLDAMLRKATLAAWDHVYTMIRNRKVGDLLRLEEHAAWLAERTVEALLPVLARPHVLRLIAAETARAGSRREVG